MALKDDLEKKVKEYFDQQWTTRNGTVVPSDDSIGLGNDAVKLKATVLYADLADSTKLVDGYRDWFAAAIYKSFLHYTAKIISSAGGWITAYDGDRVMAVFLGENKDVIAVRTALKINWAAKKIVQPAKDAKWPTDHYKLHHVCGVDASDLFVARTGIRGSNDLVWVGHAANYAAKMAAFDHNKPTWITADIYNSLPQNLKCDSDGKSIWIHHTWGAMNNMSVYSSTYWQSF